MESDHHQDSEDMPTARDSKVELKLHPVTPSKVPRIRRLRWKELMIHSWLEGLPCRQAAGRGKVQSVGDGTLPKLPCQILDEKLLQRCNCYF